MIFMAVKKKHVFLVVFILLLSSFAFAAECGDDTCDDTENKCTCPADCGQCSGDVSGEICKAWACISNQCTKVTKANCCGNDSCEVAEDYGNCPSDCRPTSIELEVLDPDFDSYYIETEAVLFKAIITSSGTPALLADANISSELFGTVPLYNDGAHNDEKAFDSIYANSFVIPTDAPEGTYALHVDTNFFGVVKRFTFDFVVGPPLEINVTGSPKQVLGDFVTFTVNAQRKGTDLPTTVEAKLYDPNNLVVLEETVESTGSYEFRYRTSLLDSLGNWRAEISVTDELGNVKEATKTIELVEAEKVHFLTVEVTSDFDPAYKRGEDIFIEAQVKDPNEILVEGAILKLIDPSDNEYVFSEPQPGNYQISYPVGFALSSGENEFRIDARKNISGVTFNGSEELDLTVSEGLINIKIESPTKEFFRIGEIVLFNIELMYPDRKAVRNADLNLVFNERSITGFSEYEPGHYRAEYRFSEDDLGSHLLSLDAADEYNNRGSTSLTIEISRRTFLYELEERLPLLMLVFGIAIAAGVFLIMRYSKLNKIAELEKRKKKLEDLEVQLQEEYFKGSAMSREDYDRTMASYESRLADINNKLKKLTNK